MFQATLKIFAFVCLMGICGCNEKGDLKSTIENLSSGNFQKIRQAQIRLIALCKQDPKAVRRMMKTESNPETWALVLYCAGESHSVLFTELLQDVTETEVPLGTAVKYIESSTLRNLSGGERLAVREKFESRLASINSSDQKDKVNEFLLKLKATENK